MGTPGRRQVTPTVMTTNRTVNVRPGRSARRGDVLGGDEVSFAEAVRRYLLAGLLACGRCGRRVESAWSNGKPAYRCCHGYTSAAGPEPGRSPNAYVREDQILPHLAAIAILLAVPARKPHRADCGLA